MFKSNYMYLPKLPKKLLFLLPSVLLPILLLIFAYRRSNSNSKTSLYFYLPDSSKEVPDLIQGQLINKENSLLALGQEDQQVLVEIDPQARFYLVYPGNVPEIINGSKESSYLEEIPIGSNLSVGGLQPRSQGGWIGTHSFYRAEEIGGF